MYIYFDQKSWKEKKEPNEKLENFKSRIKDHKYRIVSWKTIPNIYISSSNSCVIFLLGQSIINLIYRNTEDNISQFKARPNYRITLYSELYYVHTKPKMLECKSCWAELRKIKAKAILIIASFTLSIPLKIWIFN